MQTIFFDPQKPSFVLSPITIGAGCGEIIRFRIRQSSGTMWLPDFSAFELRVTPQGASLPFLFTATEQCEGCVVTVKPYATAAVGVGRYEISYTTVSGMRVWLGRGDIVVCANGVNGASADPSSPFGNGIGIPCGAFEDGTQAYRLLTVVEDDLGLQTTEVSEKLYELGPDGLYHETGKELANE